MPQSPDVWQYSSNRIECRFGALDLIRAADPNAGVLIEPLTDVWREVLGCDGEVIRVRVSRFQARVTVSISQSSAANQSLLQNTVVDAVSGLGVRPFSFIDLDAGVSFVSPTAYIVSVPTMQFAGANGFANWVFSCPYLTPAALPGAATGVPIPV